MSIFIIRFRPLGAKLSNFSLFSTKSYYAISEIRQQRSPSDGKSHRIQPNTDVAFHSFRSCQTHVQLYLYIMRLPPSIQWLNLSLINCTDGLRILQSQKNTIFACDASVLLQLKMSRFSQLYMQLD